MVKANKLVYTIVSPPEIIDPSNKNTKEHYEVITYEINGPPITLEV